MGNNGVGNRSSGCHGCSAALVQEQAVLGDTAPGVSRTGVREHIHYIPMPPCGRTASFAKSGETELQPWGSLRRVMNHAGFVGKRATTVESVPCNPDIMRKRVAR